MEDTWKVLKEMVVVDEEFQSRRLALFYPRLRRLTAEAAKSDEENPDDRHRHC